MTVSWCVPRVSPAIVYGEAHETADPESNEHVVLVTVPVVDHLSVTVLPYT